MKSEKERMALRHSQEVVFSLSLYRFGASGWIFNDITDQSGFENQEISKFGTGMAFCLSNDHDSLFDCIHFHGVRGHVRGIPIWL